MAKKYRIIEKEGYQEIVTCENSDLQLLNFSILNSIKLKNFKGVTADKETVFILTKGKLKFFTKDMLLGKMERKSVFEGPPYAVYLPPFTEYFIEFEEETEICIVSCKSEVRNKAKLITPNDLKFRRVGEETFYRNINDIIGESFPAEKLLIGETINDKGNWSSYPPHKHDKDNFPDETKMEELYFFKIFPETGFGVIRVFDEEQDNLFLLQNNDVITIPKGYHPVGVVPKHQIYYLWALAGEKRVLKPYTHPDFRD